MARDGSRRIGCGAVAFLTVAAITGVVTGFVRHERALYLPPPARYLRRGALIGTWEAPGNGRLTLRSDGRFTAKDVCGAGLGSDAGTWTVRPGRITGVSSQLHTGGVNLAGTLGPNGFDEMAEGQDHGHAILWTFRGAPDDSKVCELRKL